MHNKNSFITTIQGIRNMLNECELMCNTALRLYENKEFEDANEVCMDMVPVGDRDLLKRIFPDRHVHEFR